MRKHHRQRRHSRKHHTRQRLHALTHQHQQGRPRQRQRRKRQHSLHQQLRQLARSRCHRGRRRRCIAQMHRIQTHRTRHHPPRLQRVLPQHLPGCGRVHRFRIHPLYCQRGCWRQTTRGTGPYLPQQPPWLPHQRRRPQCPSRFRPAATLTPAHQHPRSWRTRYLTNRTQCGYHSGVLWAIRRAAHPDTVRKLWPASKVTTTHRNAEEAYL